MAKPYTPRKGAKLRHKGQILPFTFWPENYLKYGPIFASECWTCLSNFVIRSSVPEKIKLRVLAYIEQSRDFYSASEKASFTTKPLMLYYSYLNLVNAFLLFRGKITNIDFNAIHGLKPFYPRRYRALTSLGVKLQPSRSGSTSVHIFNSLVEECNFPKLVINKKYNLQDFLCQIVNLRQVGQLFTKGHTQFFPIRLEFMKDDCDNAYIKGYIDTSKCNSRSKSSLIDFLSGNKCIRRVRDSSKSLKAYRIVIESIAQTHYHGPNLASRLRNNLIDKIRNNIWSEQTYSGFRYYLCIDGKFTAQIATDFAIMFTLGMIARYRPDMLNKVIERDQWIIHEYLANQPLQFIYLLSSGIIRNGIIPITLK